MAQELASTRNSLDNLKTLFDKARPAIEAVVPRHLTGEKILKITLSAASRTPDLLKCTPQSILLAVMQSAALGLEPNTPLGHAYLIPYRNGDKFECQFIPGYKGLIKLAIQSGDVASVWTRVVHQGDHFEVLQGTEERLVHRPVLGRDDSQAAVTMLCVYAVAKMKDGSVIFEVMTKAQVDAIRSRSRASKGGPWVTDYEEMARKTAVRRLAKYLPLSPELAQALRAQEIAEAGDAPEAGDFAALAAEITPKELGNGDTLAAKVRAKADEVAQGAEAEAPQ